MHKTTYPASEFISNPGKPASVPVGTKLTLFSLPKPFSGIFDTIQRNAIESWLALAPRPEIILFGNETGTAEIAKQYGLHHEPAVERNELGTPLVNHLFRAATKLTRTSYQCFLNSDIILDPSLPKTLDTALNWRNPVMLVSRRWDLNLTERISADYPAWFAALAEKAKNQGELYTPLGMDVFVFPTGFFDHMPPFSIGWPGAKYDNWLIYAARAKHIPVVDLTSALTTIHQNHPSGDSTSPHKAREHWISLDLLGGHGCCYDILDATHVMDEHGAFRRQPWQRDRVIHEATRLVKRWRYTLRRRLFGFRYAQPT